MRHAKSRDESLAGARIIRTLLSAEDARLNANHDEKLENATPKTLSLITHIGRLTRQIFIDYLDVHDPRLWRGAETGDLNIKERPANYGRHR